ncbi:unnamed protein product [Auanema sp. JU1783]|nr:unnamed protein product [Auanema sp. JU1783]
MNTEHWRTVWPCAPHLANFLLLHKEMLADKVIIELGAGCTGLAGSIAIRCGAKKVIFTDHPKIHESLQVLTENVTANDEFMTEGQEYEILGLDWAAVLKKNASVEDFGPEVAKISHVDYIIGSDVFYEPNDFKKLVRTVSVFVKKFPKLRFYFSYQVRDESDSIEHLLLLEGLECHLLRTVHEDITIQIGLIQKAKAPLDAVFAGIEGGATHSKLVFARSDGSFSQEVVGPSTNPYLNGFEETGDTIGNWVRESAYAENVELPLESLGMGLSGAEDEDLNKHFVRYMSEHHGDIAKSFHLVSDAVCALQASFENEGIIAIVGTGSSFRMLSASGEVFCVGGWGHLIGDEASGFWIAQKAIKMLFDAEDRVQRIEDIDILRKLIYSHFKITRKMDLLNMLYTNFEKSVIAALTLSLSKRIDVPIIAKLFYDAGYEIGKQISGFYPEMSEEMKECCNVVVIGSVFKSWPCLKLGFYDCMKARKQIRRAKFYKSTMQPAIGAILFAAKKCKMQIVCERELVVLDDITFAPERAPEKPVAQISSKSTPKTSGNPPRKVTPRTSINSPQKTPKAMEASSGGAGRKD